MFQRLIRQQRRFIFAAFFAGLAGALIGGVSLAVTLALISALACAVILFAAPGLRTWCEAGSLGMFLAAALTGPLAWLPGPIHLPLALILAAPAAWGCFQLFYGKWSDRIPGWFGWSSTGKTATTAAPQEMWERLVPGRGDLGDAWIGPVADVSADPEEPDTVHLAYAPGSPIAAETITFLEERPFEYARYYYFADSTELPGDMVEGTVEIWTLPAITGGCEIEVTDSRTALRTREALMAFFDDHAADSCDSLAARLAGSRDWSLGAALRPGSA